MAIPATFRLPAQNVDGFDDCQLNFENLQTLFSAPTGLFQPAKAFWAASQGVAFTNGATLPLDTVAFDYTGGAMHTGSPGYFQCPAAGIYWMTGSVNVTATAANQLAFATCVLNTSGNYRLFGGTYYSGAAEPLYAQVSGVVKCAAGDKIMTGYNGTGGLTGVSNGSEVTNNLMVMRVA